MTPDEYCQQKAVQSGSSFYYSFLFLPPERRRAITALSPSDSANAERMASTESA